jgi:hypothetical protein
MRKRAQASDAVLGLCRAATCRYWRDRAIPQQHTERTSGTSAIPELRRPPSRSEWPVKVVGLPALAPSRMNRSIAAGEADNAERIGRRARSLTRPSAGLAEAHLKATGAVFLCP